MERIWLKSYPPGVPAEIDAGAYASIGDLFAQSVARFGRRTAYRCMGKAIAHVAQQALPGTRVRHVVVTGMGDMLGMIKGRLVNAAVRHVKKLVPAWHIHAEFRRLDFCANEFGDWRDDTSKVGAGGTAGRSGCA